MPTNLLAHHLAVLERAGLVRRDTSSGDRRRRYVRLDDRALDGLAPRPSQPPPTRVVFVCTHNSARSQLAAALWCGRGWARPPRALEPARPNACTPVRSRQPAAPDSDWATPCHGGSRRPISARRWSSRCATGPTRARNRADLVALVGSRSRRDRDPRRVRRRHRRGSTAASRSPPDHTHRGSPEMTTGPPSEALTTEQRLQIGEAARRLAEEFAGTFSAETIERFIADSQARLESRARITTWLPVLIERFTRDRLRAPLGVSSFEWNEAPAVLFLCVHNAGRSQMAAGWLRHLAGGAVEIFSGGSDPGSETNAVAVEAMAEVGIDITAEYPKPWTDEIARAADVIVTMGCGDACPVLPGKRYEDWELTDPAGQPIEVVRAVRDDIRDRVRELITSLDVPARA
ncbi:MAG: hypothetical protein U5R31_02625 [Acidimicrobiia bacterium]|nr:hypothetical protein [Acidimicrobiia bacterium]